MMLSCGTSPIRCRSSGRLAGPARADDPQQAALGDREADVVEEHLAAGHLDDQVLRDQGDVSGVDVLPQLVAGQPECGVPDADDVLLGKRG
jgi:hypothetical protein